MKTDNELIAEFMGLVRIDPNKYYSKAAYHDALKIKEPHSKPLYSFIAYHDSLRYDSSWDWLMPVVEKINSLQIEGYKEINFSVEGNVCGWIAWSNNRPGNQNQDQFYSEKKPMIAATYEAVVEFIKWANIEM